MEPLDVPPNGAVYYLDQLSFGTGWKKIDGATDGGFGRKAFIRGKKTNSGCWFSTDYLAEGACGSRGGVGWYMTVNYVRARRSSTARALAAWPPPPRHRPPCLPAADLWVFYEPSVQSTNEFATSPSATVRGHTHCRPWRTRAQIDRKCVA